MISSVRGIISFMGFKSICDCCVTAERNDMGLWSVVLLLYLHIMSMKSKPARTFSCLDPNRSSSCLMYFLGPGSHHMPQTVTTAASLYISMVDQPYSW